MSWEYFANAAFGYLLGSIPFGLVVGYLWLHEDIRRRGSGKTGTTNVLRTAGKLPAALVLVGDLSKGLVPAIVGNVVFDSAGAAAAGAAAALVGHVLPVFAGFRGGRGVATAFGGVLGLTPLVALAFPIIAACILIPTRIVSLMSIVGTALAGSIVVVVVLFGWEPAAYAVYAIIAVAIIEYMHIPNLRRLLSGTEPRLGQGGDRSATG
jgi:glycerol-3-phosphate acyltransferase PlsY